MEKNVFIIVALLLFSGVFNMVQGQQTNVVEIKTSAQCQMYKEKIRK